MSQLWLDNRSSQLLVQTWTCYRNLQPVQLTRNESLKRCSEPCTKVSQARYNKFHLGWTCFSIESLIKIYQQRYNLGEATRNIKNQSKQVKHGSTLSSTWFSMVAKSLYLSISTNSARLRTRRRRGPSNGILVDNEDGILLYHSTFPAWRLLLNRSVYLCTILATCRYL